ncbi:MAG: ABC transporter substrate-binding protein [Acetobacteraceae bacterium]|nr:ABC transporter substrate-binding protein [Acetobacteraceae bacterium]
MTATTRRALLKAATGAPVALGAPMIWRKASAQDRRIVVRDSGGPFTKGFSEAFYKPFREATGIEVVGVASTHEPTAQIRSMVETKNFVWDGAEISIAAVRQLAAGGFVERHGLENDPAVKQLSPEFIDPYGVGSNVYATILAYRRDRFEGRRPPQSWADLWDVRGIPGRRAMRKHPFDTIEQALMADGVPRDKVYPCDLDRAFKSLDRIKPHVITWWTGGTQATQMLISGEVDMVPTWVARAQAAIDEGAPVGVSWEGNIWSYDSWCIVKGTPKADLVREFIKFTCDAKRQAAFTPFVSNGPTNPDAFRFIDPKKAASLPTAPENKARGLLIDDEYWAKNKDAAIERFNGWLLT